MDKNKKQVNIEDTLLLTHGNKSYTLDELQQKIEQLQDKLFFTQEELKDYKTHFDRVSLELKTKEQQLKELKGQVDKQKNAKIQLSKLSDRQLKHFCNMKQALCEIEHLIQVNKKELEETLYNDYDDQILNIINKTKGEPNE